MKRFLLTSAAGVATLSLLPLMATAASVHSGHRGEPTSPSATNYAHPHVKMKSNATATYQSGITPSQMRTAYGINLLSQTGAGKTIAIVDAYGSPTIQNDLNTFDAQFGLPNTTIQIAQPSGAPATNGGWALETALDVEWAHAIAPQANILLVEAKSASTSDLLTAIDYASSHGAVVVSNSWGGSEFSTETSNDAHFQHTGVVYVASAGDGSTPEWPSVSPYVLAVGGTTLTIDANGNYVSESAWPSGTGGHSIYEPRPSYQNVVQSQVGPYRGVPDVAMDADPNTGAAVYDSTPDNGTTGWFQVGGTSLTAPMWAALVALTDQNRASSYTSLDAISQLYNIYSGPNYTKDFHDIPPAGYDAATGLGSPIANNLVPDWTSMP